MSRRDARAPAAVLTPARRGRRRARRRRARDRAAATAPSRRRFAAPAAILVEPATGDVVFQRNADQRRPIASTTKLMTALVTLEHASLDDVMTAVDYRGAPVESLIGFRAGERVTVRDLLRGAAAHLGQRRRRRRSPQRVAGSRAGVRRR